MKPLGEIGGRIDYAAVLAGVKHVSVDSKIALLRTKLAEIWKAAYLAMTPRQADIYVIRHGTFQYLYDNYTMLEAAGKVPYHPTHESRVVAAFGVSKPQKIARDDFRLKKWVGPTETYFGRDWDKGHFIAHSIGGAVDQCELNVFVQSRRLNRGWTVEGKRFREMESYCAHQSGTFCFNRPIYSDGSAKPVSLEFGLLKTDGEWWVEVFGNI